ncbi:hypothetical protein KMZ68_07010 [Bradyrhizobium sediminis]|uniref:Uncharacterized protein n=1 Tax=Bradyrhizobium sediminis TaxID=2840469 RepID=A0A975NRY6_9BRAD|nr:hypothetical protein [Bradyrhizobium sediminis]QWG19581.1 hypothetical protein KMZ68_07010 [Bradyrhizobium sediminis]
MRWFKRAIAMAVVSMNIALAGVGATYGREQIARNGGAVADQNRVTDAIFASVPFPTHFGISDAARRPFH